MTTHYLLGLAAWMAGTLKRDDLVRSVAPKERARRPKRDLKVDALERGKAPVALHKAFDLQRQRRRSAVAFDRW